MPEFCNGTVNAIAWQAEDDAYIAIEANPIMPAPDPSDEFADPVLYSAVDDALRRPGTGQRWT